MNTLFKAYDCQLYYNYGHLESLCESLLNENNLTNYNVELIKGNSTQKENLPEMKYKNITIKKHKTKNLWYCRIRINGKQEYLSSKNQNECLNKLKQAIKQKNSKNNLLLKNIKFTLEKWFYEWLDIYKKKSTKNIKETTIKDYKKLVKHFNKYKDIELNKFNNIMIIELLNKIPYQRTKQKMYQLLKQLFEKAYINKIIKDNPIIDIERPEYTSKEKIILNEQEELQFINECKQCDFGDFFLICLFQGLRRGECLGITRKDIDFNNLTLDINKSINAGTKAINTKNNVSIRNIPIFKQTLPILEKYKDLNSDNRLFNCTPSAIDKKFKIIKDKLKLNITINSLRHNFITKLVENKIPEYIIKQIVGHSKGSTIAKKVYTHIREEAYNKAIEIINKID